MKIIRFSLRKITSSVSSRVNSAITFAGVLTLAFTGIAVPSANGEIAVADRHVYMLNAGQDTVWGTYMFGVNNTDEAPATLRATVVLPVETTDFEPQDGLTKADLKVDADGGLFFEREFPNGLTLVAIGFKIPASFGSADISFTPDKNIPDFSVLAKTNGLTLTSSSSIMQKAKDTLMSKTKYTSMKSVAALEKGSEVKIRIANVPQGRAQYWVTGSLFGGLILLLVIGLTIKTRNQASELADVQV